MKTETNTTSLAVIGVDIGKEALHLVGLSDDGKIAFRKKIRRLALKDAFEQLPPCIVGMEACLSAHFVSRTLRAVGHEPRIIPALYTKPFVKGQKNDYNDAEAIAEAALRPKPAGVQGEEPRPARPAGISSRAVAIGVPTDGDDPPDPRLPDRARHCRQSRSPRPAQLAVCDPGEPQG